MNNIGAYTQLPVSAGPFAGAGTSLPQASGLKLALPPQGSDFVFGTHSSCCAGSAAQQSMGVIGALVGIIARLVARESVQAPGFVQPDSAPTQSATQAQNSPAATETAKTAGSGWWGVASKILGTVLDVGQALPGVSVASKIIRGVAGFLKKII